MSSIADVAFGFVIGGAVVCLVLGYLLDRGRTSRMRQEAEVRDLIRALNNFNEEIEREALASADPDEHLHAFNVNAQLLCALKWTLGEDTIKHTRKV